jgi:hypothetical protein
MWRSINQRRAPPLIVILIDFTPRVAFIEQLPWAARPSRTI